MSKRFFACVYGGASERIADSHKEKIEHLGKIIAENGFSLVYGAGAKGCMGAVARGVKEKNGTVMGISPDFIDSFEERFACDEKITVDTMAERKTLMEKYADVFFIAPGGIGTMDEFFQVLTLKYLNRIDAPIVVLNLDGFYDSLINLINDLIRQGAAAEGIHSLYEVVTEISEDTISSILKRCVPEDQHTR